MLKVSYLKYLRWRTQQRFDKDYRKLQKKKAPAEDFRSLDADEYYTLNQIDEEIRRIDALNLSRHAMDLDIELPAHGEEEMWTNGEDGQYTYLSMKGRSHLRRLVDAEKSRRFEVKTLWVTRFSLLLFAAFVGIIGALTGLIAVLHNKK